MNGSYDLSYLLNLLTANFTKWSNALKQFVGKLLMAELCNSKNAYFTMF